MSVANRVLAVVLGAGIAGCLFLAGVLWLQGTAWTEVHILNRDFCSVLSSYIESHDGAFPRDWDDLLSQTGIQENASRVVITSYQQEYDIGSRATIYVAFGLTPDDVVVGSDGLPYDRKGRMIVLFFLREKPGAVDQALGCWGALASQMERHAAANERHEDHPL